MPDGTVLFRVCHRSKSRGHTTASRGRSTPLDHLDLLTAETASATTPAQSHLHSPWFQQQILAADLIVLALTIPFGDAQQ